MLRHYYIKPDLCVLSYCQSTKLCKKSICIIVYSLFLQCLPTPILCEAVTHAPKSASSKYQNESFHAIFPVPALINSRIPCVQF